MYTCMQEDTGMVPVCWHAEWDLMAGQSPTASAWSEGEIS